jgi:hypothetical protein
MNANARYIEMPPTINKDFSPHHDNNFGNPSPAIELRGIIQDNNPPEDIFAGLGSDHIPS